jgi:23S rRNA (guanosine2251-2'-O)-methyltransferase
VRPLVRARCDQTVRIPMAGKLQSLNAATAAAVVAFEALRQRHHV